MLSRALPVATQRCDKHISAAANQHATVHNAVFSACQALTSHNSAEREKDHVRCFLCGPYKGL
jgi:hypothetical protein